MIQDARAAQLESPGEFAGALSSWMAGGRDVDEEAASIIVAETMHMWRKVLESKFKR